MSESASAPEHSKVGIVTSMLYDGGSPIVRDLVSCVHCGYVWIWETGSGRRRGFCMSCNGLVCGHKACVANGCVHRMRGIENMEQGRADNYKPIIVHVDTAPPVG
jgi:hypothetical protein